MKAKIDLEKFISSMLGYAEDNCEETMLDYLHSALQDQGLEYKDGKIAEIDTIDTSSPEWTEIVERCKHTTLEPVFFEKGKWYTCIAKVDGFKVGHTYQSKMDGTVSNDSGAMYGYHNDVNLIFRPATEEEIPHEPPSKPDYEDLSIINEGDDGVLLYFTKNGRGISDFRISKDTARWLHGRLGEYLEMYDDKEPKEQEEREDLRKRYERIGKSNWFKKTHEGMSVTIPDDLEGTDMDGGVVGEKGEQGETPFNRKRLEEVAKPETLEEKVEHWQRMHDIAMEKIKGEFKEEDSLETKAIKEHMENLKKRIEDNQLGCIVQRLDKIIELLQSAILVLPKEPYVPPIIYKRPLDPDPNVLGGWTTTASTFGSDYDIDTDKIKQDETNKPES